MRKPLKLKDLFNKGRVFKNNDMLNYITIKKVSLKKEEAADTSLLESLIDTLTGKSPRFIEDSLTLRELNSIITEKNSVINRADQLLEIFNKSMFENKDQHRDIFMLPHSYLELSTIAEKEKPKIDDILNMVFSLNIDSIMVNSIVLVVAEDALGELFLSKIILTKDNITKDSIVIENNNTENPYFNCSDDLTELVFKGSILIKNIAKTIREEQMRKNLKSFDDLIEETKSKVEEIRNKYIKKARETVADNSEPARDERSS